MNRQAVEHVARPIAAGLLLLLTLLPGWGPRSATHALTIFRSGSPHRRRWGSSSSPDLSRTPQAPSHSRPSDPRRTPWRRSIVVMSTPRSLSAPPARGSSSPAPQVTRSPAGSPPCSRAPSPPRSGARVKVVHPLPAGDPHGIVLFFLVLATLVSSVVVGALAALGTAGRSWTMALAIITLYAVIAGVAGTLAADWLSGYADGLLLSMGIVTLLCSPSRS